LAFVFLTERGDAWKDQDQIYDAFLKAALDKYGKGASTTSTQ
jgi:hypothetical protein